MDYLPVRPLQRKRKSNFQLPRRKRAAKRVVLSSDEDDQAEEDDSHKTHNPEIGFRRQSNIDIDIPVLRSASSPARLKRRSILKSIESSTPFDRDVFDIPSSLEFVFNPVASDIQSSCAAKPKNRESRTQTRHSLSTPPEILGVRTRDCSRSSRLYRHMSVGNSPPLPTLSPPLPAQDAPQSEIQRNISSFRQSEPDQSSGILEEGTPLTSRPVLDKTRTMQPTKVSGDSTL